MRLTSHITALHGLLACIVLASSGFAQSNTQKSVLYVVGGNRVNQVDHMLIDGLKAQGVEVKTLSNSIGGYQYKISSEIVSEAQSTPAAPPKKSKASDPANPPFSADYQMGGNWNDSLLSGFDAVILNDTITAATSNHPVPLPWKEILRSGKLVVFGETRSVAEGESLLSTGKVTNKDGQVKPYACDAKSNRVSYVVFRHTWQRGMQLPTDADTKEFITTTLVPKIKAGL